MKSLKILALGRNQIKRIEKLDDLADTLEELWISYNLIGSLDGLAQLSKLQVLYISNNGLKSYDELEKLVSPACTLHLWVPVYNPMPLFVATEWVGGAEGCPFRGQPDV